MQSRLEEVNIECAEAEAGKDEAKQRLSELQSGSKAEEQRLAASLAKVAKLLPIQSVEVLTLEGLRSCPSTVIFCIHLQSMLAATVLSSH
ncbi:MAG: hypothetical protein EOO85_31240 [Pedobacter sp.]|nr:MAG: hypothetical protein EOO85_31240 [Pedobacter sp.]